MRRSIKLGDYEDVWITNIGLVYPGRQVLFRDKDLFGEMQDVKWMELLLFGITGRRFNSNQLRLFEGIWVISTSYPDHRIWNNAVASLGGTVRTTAALAVSAATAVSEANIYGFKPMLRVFDLLRRLNDECSRGVSLSLLLDQERQQGRIIPGYGRPIADSDERIVPLMKLAESLSLSSGQHVKLAFSVEEVLCQRNNKLRMNVAALMAALCADQGLSSLEYKYYILFCFSAGMLPCYLETSSRLAGTFLPLRCDRIAYRGDTRLEKWT